MDQHCIFDGRRIQADTGAGGLCKDCLQTGFVSYFCSQACWNVNRVSSSYFFLNHVEEVADKMT